MIRPGDIRFWDPVEDHVMLRTQPTCVRANRSRVPTGGLITVVSVPPKAAHLSDVTVLYLGRVYHVDLLWLMNRSKPALEPRETDTE